MRPSTTRPLAVLTSALLFALLLPVALSPSPSSFVASAHGGAPPPVVLADDGAWFYDRDGDCVGDTDDNEFGALPVHHWHVGLPMVGAEHEDGGFGCLGGPRTWQLDVPEGQHAHLLGAVRYAPDKNVGSQSQLFEVHLHVFDAAGVLVASSLVEGAAPTSPGVVPEAQHQLHASLAPGPYTVVEDVFNGRHGMWLTRIIVAS